MGGGVVVDRPPLSRFFMKINKLFHWLYFIVMMLPIFVLPIFALAVRSDSNYQPISIQVGETHEITTINYRYETNEVNTFNDLIVGNVYNFNSTLTLDDITGTGYEFSFYLLYADYIDFQDNTFLEYVSDEFEGSDSLLFNVNSSSALIYSNYDLNEVLYFELTNFVFYLPSSNDLNNFLDFCFDMSLNVNTITSSDFNIITGVTTDTIGTTVTYNDTDFGSQTIYTLYKEVDTYFNYDNVFNFGDLYIWLNTNFFSGNAPLGFFIFWHLLIYWLLTSLLWLLFDVLIYVPQLVHRWLDKASLS